MAQKTKGGHGPKAYQVTECFYPEYQVSTLPGTSVGKSHVIKDWAFLGSGDVSLFVSEMVLIRLVPYSHK